ncbi:hypothetical protein HPP92_020230 [Vanilla planifolia]|uniref:Uncharacterized protein n=1 Tax=Vanilla planifolia TaxID=51239 RepID=A0A835UG35_VANPL|nr:hypothetical protein HPP92_020230 [Vanilla planifolia]
MAKDKLNEITTCKLTNLVTHHIMNIQVDTVTNLLLIVGFDQVYIVYMGEKQHEDPAVVTASHHRLLSAHLGSTEEAVRSLVYSYRHAFSGFSARLTKSQAKKLQELPEVVSVRRSRMHRVHTTRSWDFLGLTKSNPPSGLLKDANYGDGVIVGVVDTGNGVGRSSISGIWPESRSFLDEGYGPVPSKWKGTCQTGQAFGPSNCTRKIIGARWYVNGVDKADLVGEYLSARDFNGHGTHTASTAAGNFVDGVSFGGRLGAGTARGGAPRARLAVYKACWGSGRCPEAAVLKAIDDAVHDGVDVLSLSLGGDGYPSATIRAVARGINVVFAGGNNGPAPQTIENELPWVITVAATTIDRSFATNITLGNKLKLVGQSIYIGSQTDLTGLVYGGSCDAETLRTINATNQLVLCYSRSTAASTLPRVDLPQVISNIKKAQASGLLYAQYPTDLLDFLYSCQGFPCVLVDYRIANVILNYVITSNNAVAMVSPTMNTIGSTVLSPKVAAFSSRGPSPVYPDLLKPDIAAPGVSILAAVENAYIFLSGTSMACPHVSGVVALLKAVHPDWSPAAIKSAIVTTASVTDGFGLAVEADGVPRKIADHFDYGGGQIVPTRAADPGLVYDIDSKDYLDYLNCTRGVSDTCKVTKPLYFLNLPSIAIPELKTSLTVGRTVTNVGEVEAVYRADIRAPPGVDMTVEPPVLEFNAIQKVRSFVVRFVARQRVQGDYRFGSLTWLDGGRHLVRIPIAVRVVIQDLYSDTS